jgi:plasmid stabilization system protein ParE
MFFRSAQADRWPEALRGRIHSARPAPGIGPRRRKGHPPGRRRPSRRLKSAFQGALTPGVGLRRRKGFSRSAQADRWP